MASTIFTLGLGKVSSGHFKKFKKDLQLDHFFRLGNEKYKSKNSYRARWLEQFDLHLFDDDQMLELVICGKYNTFGKCTIDLRSLPRERTHGIWQPLEECTGEVHLMLTISGTTASETITDLTSYKENPIEKATLLKRYVSLERLTNLEPHFS